MTIVAVLSAALSSQWMLFFGTVADGERGPEMGYVNWRVHQKRLF